MLACLDGTVCDASEARLPVTDEGLLRGDGVFEVMRLYDGRRRLDEHLAADDAARAAEAAARRRGRPRDVARLLEAARPATRGCATSSPAAAHRVRSARAGQQPAPSLSLGLETCRADADLWTGSVPLLRRETNARRQEKPSKRQST
jgi:hypothetical protein